MIEQAEFVTRTDMMVNLEKTFSIEGDSLLFPVSTTHHVFFFFVRTSGIERHEHRALVLSKKSYLRSTLNEMCAHLRRFYVCTLTPLPTPPVLALWYSLPIDPDRYI